MLTSIIQRQLDKFNCGAKFFQDFESGRDATLHISSSARPLMCALMFKKTKGGIFIIMPGENAAHKFASQVALFIGRDNVLELCDYPFDYFELKEFDKRAIAKRNEALFALQNNEKKVIVASTLSCLRLNCGDVCPIQLKKGVDVEGVESLFEALSEKGYVRSKKVQEPGDFAFIGGTLYMYPGNLDFPIAVDLFGDEIESIRRVFPSTGQTISELNDVSIFSITELCLSKNCIAKAINNLRHASKVNRQLREILEYVEQRENLQDNHLLFDFLVEDKKSVQDFVGRDFVNVFCDSASILIEAKQLLEKYEMQFRGSSLGYKKFVCGIDELNFDSNQHCSFESRMTFEENKDDSIKIMRTNLAGAGVGIIERIDDWLKTDHRIIYCSGDQTAKRNFIDMLQENSISFCDVEKYDEKKKRVVYTADISIPIGFVVPSAKLVLISESDIHGHYANAQYRSTVDVTKITFPYKPGDFVVHANFGIAKFEGIIRREVDGYARDYMDLSYAEGDKLFLPVEQLDRVTRYVGAQGDRPKLTRLNTKDWSSAVKRARAATKRLAFDLVDVYSRRSVANGFSHKITKKMKLDLASTFPYDETPDQRRAIEDVYADMSSERVMDRLICGDVGFGKTEVAMRAAYVATKNQKQTMMLCPTTILAQQHYETFCSRLGPLGVKIGAVSRFKTSTEQKKCLEKFADGKIDVLVGTHRLLSRDVNPKNLGLVIVDEEQRFGVGHKEQLKNLRETIDVLTLSATPIPRTLQMSLSGIREMSLILTPPKQRMAVDVHVGMWDSDVVCEAIRFEMSRGGQVYYVSNRVKTIDDALERVQENVPEARVGVVHGQMTKDQLERVMNDFVTQKIDVLIATTIIESGIDNSKTNTLIIEDSQRLGLSQMYQLKGRVGRSSIQAHAYFMYPDNAPLSEDARARLMAIDEHQELGSGLRIAMRDLEIRGAGNMFGAEQSGNMSAVGFDLFASMLAQAVMDEREGKDSSEIAIHALSDIQINIAEATFISDEYIEDAGERVLFYRKLANALTEADINSIYSEMVEKYPDPPIETQSVFAKTLLRALMYEREITSISVAGGYLLVENIELANDKLIELKKLGAIYFIKKKRLKVPIKNIQTESSILQSVFMFIKNL